MGKTTWIILITMAVGAAILAFGDPASTAWPLKCPLFQLTGWQCPLCGMQRMVHELLHLHFADAYKYNKVLCILLPYFVALGIGQLRPELQQRGIIGLCYRNGTIFSVLTILVAWGVIRNLN